MGGGESRGEGGRKNPEDLKKLGEKLRSSLKEQISRRSL